MALCWVLLCSSYSNAQVDSTTGNLINFTGTPTATTSNWVNGVYVNQICFQAGQPGNCGPNPSIRASSGNINFSYGNVDLHQIVNINAALAAGGNGVQLSGFNYSFTAKNGNGWDNGQQDYLAAYVKLYNSAGQLAANYDYTSQTNRRYNWTNFSFNETFAAPQLASQYSTAQVGFVGRDTNFWAGNYGPEIMNVSFALKYRVDPCSLNPAYSPNCSGFSNVVTSGNLINSDLMSNGNTVYNAFAISTALKSSGSGVDVYGFNYGYNYSLGNGTFGCTATNQDGSCSWWMTTNPNATMRATLTDSNNKVIYSATQSRSTPDTAENVSYQYLLPSTTNSLLLGTFTLSASTLGNAAIQNMYANVLYKPDPCVANPLYSTTCPGYATAYAKNMILGSTVASASGPVSSSTGNSMTSNTGTVDQSQGNTQPEQTQQTQQSQQQPQQTQQPGPSPQQDTSQNPSVAQDNPAQPSPTQQGPASTTPQPAGGPPQTATASAPQQSSGPGGGGSAGPSKLAMSVLKTAQANDKATQTAAVQNAAKTLENASQSSQASSNMAISMNQDMSANSATAAANFAGQTTQASVQVTTQSSQGSQQTSQSTTQSQQASRSGPQVQQQQDTQVQMQSTSVIQVQAPQQQETQQAQVQPSTSVVRLMPPQQQEQQQSQSQMTAGMMLPPQNTYTPPQQQQQDTQSTQVSMLKPPTPPVIETQQQTGSSTGLVVNRNMFAYNPLISSGSSASLAPQQPQTMYQPRLDTRQSEVETPQPMIASFGGIVKAGNPLSEMMMQQRFEMMQNNIAAPTSSVNRNVQPNELAGKIDIATMATVPVGYQAYSIVLKDAAFYEPKEVYKNQRTVDNERVLRGLTRGSDAKHQEMIDQQYKIGN